MPVCNNTICACTASDHTLNYLSLKIVMNSWGLRFRFRGIQAELSCLIHRWLVHTCLDIFILFICLCMLKSDFWWQYRKDLHSFLLVILVGFVYVFFSMAEKLIKDCKSFVLYRWQTKISQIGILVNKRNNSNFVNQ